ncbi:MAG TPA: DMT family transporter [Actinomycetota bacterium]
MDPRLRTRGLFAITAAMCFWSTAFVMVKGSSLSGPAFALYRLWAGVAISLVAVAVTRRRLTWSAFRACALGGVLFAVDITLGFTSVKHTSVVNIGVIGALSPVVIAAISAKLLGERIALRDAALIGLSFVGVVIVVVGSADQAETTTFGNVLAFIGIATWSAYWFFTRRVRERFAPIEYFAYVMIAGALTMTPLTFVLDGAPAVPTTADWLAVWGVAIFPGFVGHSLVIWSHRYVESWRAAMITQLVPVLSSLLAWAILEEAITPVVAVGGAVVIAATGAVIVNAARRESEIIDVVEGPH